MYNTNEPKITVNLKVKFNGLETQKMIAPNADLVNLDKNTFAEKSWIFRHALDILWLHDTKSQQRRIAGFILNN